MFTTLLYYNYTILPDPEAEMVSQRALCNRLGLKGRILLAREGINGTVAGSAQACRRYMDAMASHIELGSTQFKIETGDIQPFPRLRIKVRQEIVTLGAEVDLANTAPRISPEEFHRLVQSGEVVLFDARNNYESAIGRFKGAITPDINLFKDFPEAIAGYEDLKDKPVVTYCTGGIRCEKASALMRQTGFNNVRQLDGGIINYLQAYPNGEFEGSCFVFDGRMQVTYGDATPIATCKFCEAPTSHYQNCANPQCHQLILVCDNCRTNTKTCSEVCAATLVGQP